MDNEQLNRSIDNADAQMRKGVLEFAVLLVIAKRKAYTNDIISSLREAELTVVEGTVYPLLSRLKNAGILDYSWEESNSGPPRKYYTLTIKGRLLLSGYEKQWQALSQSISNLLNK